MVQLSILPSFGMKTKVVLKKELVLKAILCLFEDSKNNIWVGSVSGLVRMNNDALIDEPRFVSITKTVTKCVVENSLGQIFLTTSGGRFSFYDSTAKLKKDQVQELTKDSILSQLQLRPMGMCFDTQGQLVLSEFQNGIYVLDLNAAMKSAKLIKVCNQENVVGINANNFSSIHKDKNDILWLPSMRNGLVKCDLNRKKFHIIRPNKKPGHLQKEVVFALMEDRKENLWIFPEKGALHFLPRESENYNSFRYLGKESGITNKLFFCIGIPD